MIEIPSHEPAGAGKPGAAGVTSDALLRELVAHLRQNRTQLREEWARRITDAQLLTAMTPQEIFSEATSVYDNYVEVLETGSVEALQAYARDLSERIIPRGVETEEVLGIVLLLRDVLARSLFKKYQGDVELLNRVFDAYEPAANRIANTVGVSFVQERERVIRQQQEANRLAELEHMVMYSEALARYDRQDYVGAAEKMYAVLRARNHDPVARRSQLKAIRVAHRESSRKFNPVDAQVFAD